MAGTPKSAGGRDDASGGGGSAVAILVWRGKCCPCPTRASVASITFFFLPTVDDDVVPDGFRDFLTFVIGSLPSVAAAMVVVVVADLCGCSLLILGSRFLRGFLITVGIFARTRSARSPFPPSP